MVRKKDWWDLNTQKDYINLTREFSERIPCLTKARSVWYGCVVWYYTLLEYKVWGQIWKWNTKTLTCQGESPSLFLMQSWDSEIDHAMLFFSLFPLWPWNTKCLLGSTRVLKQLLAISSHSRVWEAWMPYFLPFIVCVKNMKSNMVILFTFNLSKKRIK